MVKLLLLIVNRLNIVSGTLPSCHVRDQPQNRKYAAISSKQSCVYRLLFVLTLFRQKLATSLDCYVCAFCFVYTVYIVMTLRSLFVVAAAFSDDSMIEAC